MRIRVLYMNGCPHWEPTADLVRRAAEQCALDGLIEHVEVSSQDEAVRLRFLGSPTVQVDGVDIERSTHDRSDFGLACRLYGTSGVPPAEWITAAIDEATS